MLQSFTQLIKDSYSGLSKDIWILSFITLINRTGSMVIVFMTIYLTTELDFSLIQAGFAMSCYGAGSVAGSYIGGWTTDRFGYYPTMFWSLLLAGFAVMGLMYLHTFTQFCMAVFLVSMITDLFRPASMASISAYSKPENHNRSLSLIRLAINLGFAMGAAVAGFLTVKYGYKWLFIIDGITCISAAFFLRLVLKEKEEVVVKELESVPADEVQSINSESAYKDLLYMKFIGCKFLAAIVFMQLFSTVPVFIKQELLYTEQQYGYMMFCNGVIIALLEMPMVFVLEKKYNRLSLVIFGYFLIGLGFFSLVAGYLWPLAVLIFFILGISIGEIVSFPFSNAFALSRSKAGRRGEFMGIYSIAFSFAFIIAPLLGMWISERFGFSMLWWFVTGLSAIAILGFVHVKREVDLEAAVEQEVAVAKVVA